MIERRRFLTGLAGIIAAPAIVRASSLMAVRPWIGDGIALTSMAHPGWDDSDWEIDFDTDILLLRATERYSTHMVDRRFGASLPPYHTQEIDLGNGYSITRKIIGSINA